MTAFGYVRVSTKEQVEGFGLNVQIETILTKHGGVLTRDITWDEGVSGSLLDRPGLSALIAKLAPGDVVIVPRLDRLARSLLIQELLLAQIQEAGATVVSCVEGENVYLAEDTGDPSLKLIRQVLGAIAEYERATITNRMQAGIRAKKAAGGYAGGQPPYGWTGINGELYKVEAEQDALRYMRHFQFAHDNAWIANYLNREGYVTRKGKPWTRQSVRKVLLGKRTPAGAVGQDGLLPGATKVDDQVIGLYRDGGKDVGADGSTPLGLG